MLPAVLLQVCLPGVCGQQRVCEPQQLAYFPALAQLVGGGGIRKALLGGGAKKAHPPLRSF